MSYTYDTWLPALATAIVVDPADPEFPSVLPSCIDYAEQRIYPEVALRLVNETRAALFLRGYGR